MLSHVPVRPDLPSEMLSGTDACRASDDVHYAASNFIRVVVGHGRRWQCGTITDTDNP